MSNTPEQALSDATIPTRLADIQKRCAELLDDEGGLNGLTLQDPPDGDDPYSIAR